MLHIGIDVGGTFTDFVTYDDASGQVQISKVASTPHDFTQGVIKGLHHMKVASSQTRRIIHGTTIATNAVLEGKGAKTALITTQGFKDVIEIGQLRRYAPGGLFNLKWVRPKPLIPRHLRLEVPERVACDGTVLGQLRDEDIIALAEQLKKQQIQAVAICFLNSYINGSHEKRAGELFRRCLPGIPISLSVETVPEIREFERWSTTALNAYIAPLLKNYLEKLRIQLQGWGYKGEVFYMISSGGVVTEETAAAYPVRFILSGPAGAVSAGVFIGEATGCKNIITYDMGGTSTDICLIKEGRPSISSDRIFSGLPIKTPQLDIVTIGAGGGSIAWVDTEGALKVGPQSAGALPGPACYGLGGTDVTITDANLLLGRIGVNTMLSGAMRLDRELALKAISSLSQRVKVSDIYQLADGIIKICAVNMCGAVREISIERGHDPRDFALMAIGGAGPMHAIPIAEDIGLNKILVPKNPGNAAAFGLLTSDLMHDYIRTYVTELRKTNLSRIIGPLNEMADEGRRALVREGVQPDRIDIHYFLDMRYVGQSFQLRTAVPHSFEISGLERIFHQEYKRSYGYFREEKEVELVNLRVVALGRVDKPATRRNEPERWPLSKALKEERMVYFGGNFVSCPVYERALLPSGVSIDGPTIVEEFSATTVIFPEWKGTVDDFGNLILEQEV